MITIIEYNHGGNFGGGVYSPVPEISKGKKFPLFY